MDGKERRDFEEALAKAFPERVQLEMMVKHEMREELNKICAEKVNLVVTIFQLCSWAESHDKLEALLAAARKGNPDNLALRALAERRSPAQQESSPPPNKEPKLGPSAGKPVLLRDFSSFLAKLEADVTDMLERSPTARATLAKELGLDQRATARDVTHVLFHKTAGRDAVIAFNNADEALRADASKDHERRALKQLMVCVLPAATDWRESLAALRDKLARGERYIDLPLGTMTMAEVVLAGVDCRPCRWAAEDEWGLKGDALLEIPVAAGAFLDAPNKGKRLLEALVGKLAVHFFHLSPNHPELRNHEKMRRRVDSKLEFFQTVKGDDYLPRWLLLTDELLDHLGPRGVGGLGDRLNQATAVLNEGLPHLRLARVREEDYEGEYTYVAFITSFWKKPVGS